MSKQQAQIARTFDFWGGRPLKRTSSDLFFDRPRPTNTIFSGPNALWDQRYPSRELIGDIGEGQASTLRSLDLGYLTRGYLIDPPVRRAAYPGTKTISFMMNNWNRNRDVSSEDQSDLSNKSISSSYKKRQQLSTLFNKTADFDYSLFSRLFFTLYQK
ncbi:unnamed protein product [Rotaria sordida]|uniref:Uncharacterized protein n=1 Tax=Rotaria sordida TaxID=392033 RepID=A0A818V3K5_9BILA|nr:unnamed protein product [Rotaria sordida]CAF3706896.1 unnamed protein product [Rotaria sordida]